MTASRPARGFRFGEGAAPGPGAGPAAPMHNPLTVRMAKRALNLICDLYVAGKTKPVEAFETALFEAVRKCETFAEGIKLIEDNYRDNETLLPIRVTSNPSGEQLHYEGVISLMSGNYYLGFTVQDGAWADPDKTFSEVLPAMFVPKMFLLAGEPSYPFERDKCLVVAEVLQGVDGHTTVALTKELFLAKGQKQQRLFEILTRVEDLVYLSAHDKRVFALLADSVKYSVDTVTFTNERFGSVDFS